MSELQIGKFTVVGTLGSGAHSKILHVRRAADGKKYALKVVPIDGPDDQKFLEQAQHEFRVAQMLDHPNLIKVYALETVKDWLFRVRKAHLLIEYVNGKTLDTARASRCRCWCRCSSAWPTAWSTCTAAASATATSSPTTSCSAGPAT